MFSKFTLKTKLLGLCAMFTAVSLAVGVTTYISSQRISEKYNSISKGVLPKIANIDQMYQDYLNIRINLRTLGLPGLTEEQNREAAKGAADSIAEYEKDAKEYLEIGMAPGQKEYYDRVEKAWLSFKEVGAEVLALNKSGIPADKEKMVQLFFTKCPAEAKKFLQAMEDISKFHDKEADHMVADAEAVSNHANTVTLLMILVGALVGLSIGYMFANSVGKSLNNISEEISAAADQTHSGGTQLASASAQLSSGATEAAASLEETVASLEELSSMVKMNTDNAQQANMLSKNSREAAEKGASEIEKLIGSMNDIALGSKKIEEIIHVIDDIAFQTNLLALNAAVEAARAGEQGKGFAVVAEAVRTLAQKSADAAKDINSLIKDNVVKSEQGAQIASESEAVLQNILVAVKKVADLNGEIAAGSQEQSTGLEQISKAMNQLDQATQGNAASSEEVAASSEQMSEQAGGLTRMVTALKLLVNGSGGPSPAATASHVESVKPKSSSSPRAMGKKPSLKVASSSAQAIPFDDDMGDRKVGDVSGF